jgi:predicted nucleic acid-binding protein
LIHLLDINLLLALAWPTHEHHSKAMNWLRSKQQAGFLEIATCPLTELGFLRISMGAMNVDFESASRWLVRAERSFKPIFGETTSNRMRISAVTPPFGSRVTSS